MLAIAVMALLLVESAIMAADSPDPPYWNVKLATQLHWIMFATADLPPTSGSKSESGSTIQPPDRRDLTI
jgi:hypothetical protein